MVLSPTNAVATVRVGHAERNPVENGGLMFSTAFVVTRTLHFHSQLRNGR